MSRIAKSMKENDRILMRFVINWIQINILRFLIQRYFVHWLLSSRCILFCHISEFILIQFINVNEFFFVLILLLNLLINLYVTLGFFCFCYLFWLLLVMISIIDNISTNRKNYNIMHLHPHSHIIYRWIHIEIFFTFFISQSNLEERIFHIGLG